MLILTRKKDQSIIIGDDIMINVVYVGEGKVKLGINAPKDVQVNRQEVYLYLKRTKQKKIESNHNKIK